MLANVDHPAPSTPKCNPKTKNQSKKKCTDSLTNATFKIDLVSATPRNAPIPINEQQKNGKPNARIFTYSNALSYAFISKLFPPLNPNNHNAFVSTRNVADTPTTTAKAKAADIVFDAEDDDSTTFESY